MRLIFTVVLLWACALTANASGMEDILSKSSLGESVMLTPRTEQLLHQVASSGQSMDTSTDNDHVRIVKVGSYPDGCPAVGMVNFNQQVIRNFRVCSTQIFERHDNVSPTWVQDAMAQRILQGVSRQAAMYGHAQDNYFSYQITATRMEYSKAQCGYVELTISNQLFLVGNDIEEVCP